MICPICGQKLKLEEDKKMKLLIKNADYYFAKCKKKHMWDIEVDYADNGRIKLSELREDDFE